MWRGGENEGCEEERVGFRGVKGLGEKGVRVWGGGGSEGCGWKRGERENCEYL